MTNIDDSTQTPPGYWFGVIEQRLTDRMRSALADSGLRRGSWRILHTLADGPATAEELAARLPRHDERHDERRNGRGHGPDRRGGFGRDYGHAFHPGLRGQEPRDERAAAQNGGHPHPDTHQHPEGHEHQHTHEHPFAGEHAAGGHHDHFEGAFERGYMRGFDRGFAFGAVRGTHTPGGFAGGGFAGGGFPGGRGHGYGYGPFGGGYPAHPCADHRHPGAERGGRRTHRIHRVLADFVERGWVWFDGDRATLTDEGRAAHDRAFERVQTVRAELANGIPEGDYAVTLATLETMARNLGWRPSGDDEATPDGAPSMDA